MSTTLRCGNIIYKTVGSFCVRIIMLHGYFYVYIISGSFTVNNIRIQRSLAFVQVCNELLDSSLIVEGLFHLLTFSFIPENNLYILGLIQNYLSLHEYFLLLNHHLIRYHVIPKLLVAFLLKILPQVHLKLYMPLPQST